MGDCIRVRVCLAVVDDGKILLVPHLKTDAGEVQWVVPGGQVEYGEHLTEATVREFLEETGLRAEVTGLLTVSEVILSERPYHSVTISFLGRMIGGELRSEVNHRMGEKVPRWFSAEEVKAVRYHPKEAVETALGTHER